MRNKTIILAFAIITLLTFANCTVQKVPSVTTITVERVVITRPPGLYFNDTHTGLEVLVQSPSQEVLPFYNAPTVQYVRSMGLREMSSATDFKLSIITTEGLTTDRVTINVDAILKDARGIELFAQRNIYTDALYTLTNVMSINNAQNEAYTQALEQIDWNRIASFLRTEQLAKNEPQKQVQGYGDTALEQTIIRWDVQSRPQGADLFWRVVSKTPDVKSTNNKYLMTTPYEATKALDIKGLTYQTSGNVRIILRCEKDGYMSQEKEFDVRMVLDQEEISAFFRLVKEE